MPTRNLFIPSQNDIQSMRKDAYKFSHDFIITPDFTLEDKEQFKFTAINATIIAERALEQHNLPLPVFYSQLLKVGTCTYLESPLLNLFDAMAVHLMRHAREIYLLPFKGWHEDKQCCVMLALCKEDARRVTIFLDKKCEKEVPEAWQLESVSTTMLRKALERGEYLLEKWHKASQETLHSFDVLFEEGESHE